MLQAQGPHSHLIGEVETSKTLVVAEKVLASVREDVEALNSDVLDLQWVLDSRSGHDLLSQRLLDGYIFCVRQLRKASKSANAGGRSKATKEASLTISEMEDAPAEPVLFQSTPAVLLWD